MRNFLERVFVSSVVIGLITFLLLFIAHPVIRGVITLSVCMLAVVALWEYVQLAKRKGWFLPLVFLLGSCFLITASFSYSPQYTPLVFLGGIIGIIALHGKQITNALAEVSLSVFGLLYIAIPLGMILALLNLSEGRFWVIYLIAVTKSADIGGYLGGSLWGRRKLAPLISPSKTVEGLVIGLAFSLGMSLFLSMFGSISFFQSAILGIILGGIGVFGDLAESLFKRDAGKKDSNHIPGIGGVLDLLDSLFFAIPIIYFYKTL